jgi:hypothetical protein
MGSNATGGDAGMAFKFRRSASQCSPKSAKRAPNTIQPMLFKDSDIRYHLRFEMG